MAGAPKYGTSPELPSEKELALVAQIRASCRSEIEALTCKADDVVGDLRVCRFLRSKDGNVSQATEWYREFLRWRVDSSIESDRLEVVGRSPEDFTAWWSKRCNPYLPLCPYAGRNPEGHVLFFARPGMVSARKFVSHRQIPKEEDTRMLFQVLEWLLWHLDVLSREERRMVYVVKMSDFKGLAEGGRPLPVFVPEFKSFLTDWLKLTQKYYCDHDSLFLLVNTNMMFRAMFAVVKLILTKRQTSKIRVLGDASQASVQATLREYVPDACLPVAYGGRSQGAAGAYPDPTDAQIEEWYSKRHLVTPEPAPTGDLRESPADNALPNKVPEKEADAPSPASAAATTAPTSSPGEASPAEAPSPVLEEKSAPASSSCFACQG